MNGKIHGLQGRIPGADGGIESRGSGETGANRGIGRTLPTGGMDEIPAVGETMRIPLPGRAGDPITDYGEGP